MLNHFRSLRAARQERAFSRRARGQRGVLLLDAMLALVMATLVIVYGLSLMMTSSSASDGAHQTTIAYNASRQVIENMRAYRGAKLDRNVYRTSNGTLQFLGAIPQINQLNGGAAILTLEDFRSPVRKATVTISWRAGGRGAERTISVTTLVAPGGVTP